MTSSNHGDDEHARHLERLGKLKANAVSDEEEEEEEDPIKDPAVREKIDSLVADALSGLSQEHPYLEAIASDTENPRLLVLGLYLAMIKTDALQAHGVCKFCFSDLNKTSKDQLRRWTDRLSLHLWKCEMAHSPGFWRCPCCGRMVQCGDTDTKDRLSPAELEGVKDDLTTHRDECHSKMLANLKPANDDDSDDDDEPLENDNCDDDDTPAEVEVDSEDEGKGSTSQAVSFFSYFHPCSRFSTCRKALFGTGYLRLAVATKVAGARRALRRLFCPICFFLTPDGKFKKAHREGDDDVRFK
jgi:hypothetical protein